jgi:hypothetical protein
MRSERSVKVFDFVLELLLDLSMLSEDVQRATEYTQELPNQKQKTQDESVPDEEASPLTDLDRRMLGIWDFEWHWPYLNYCHGRLEITEKLSKACYMGRLYVDFGNSPHHGEAQLYEKAIVRIREKQVRVRCSEPSLPDWQPNEFVLNLDPHDDLMAGVSEHANDVRGTIAFRRRASV